MNICPVCKTRFKDTTRKCRYCNVMLEPLQSSPQTPSVAQPGKRKRAKMRVEQQTGYRKIWNRYKYPIIAVLIFLLGIVIAMIQKPEMKKAEEKTGIIASQKAYAPAIQSTVSNIQPTAPAPALDPANDLFRKAFALCSSGKCTDPQKAIEYLSEAIKLKPDYAEVYYNNGYAYFKTSQYEQSINSYSKAIIHKPHYADAYSNRGFVYLNTGNIKSGCRDAKKACELGSCKLLKAAISKGDCKTD